jgi:hypothetical protein
MPRFAAPRDATRAMPKTAPLLRLLTLVAVVAYVWYCALAEATELERVFAITLQVLTAATVAFATGRPVFALFLATWIFGTIWCSGAIKFTYLEVPAIAPDLQYFANADTLALFGRYPPILAAFFALLIFCPALLIWAWRRDPARPGWRRPLGALLSGAALGVSLWPGGPFASLYDKPMWIAVNDESFITDFVTSFHDTQIHVPRPPAPNPPVSWPAAPPSAATPMPIRPDIFAVLEESTFDPAMLEICQDKAICARSMFTPDARTRAHGLLGAHTFGGGTWTAEFSLVTGLDHTLFGNAGLYAPYNLAPRVQSTVPRLLKAQGYRVVALYPTSADFINARNAYRHYGFDQLYDGTERGLEWRIEDQKVIELGWQLYEEERTAHPGTPIFFLILTIHQHGPHMNPLDTLPAPYDQPLFDASIGDWLNLNMANYLHRNAQSDATLRWLEQRALDRPEPTVLMHFGDHQPSFDGAINNLKKRLPPDWGSHDEWATYYTIRANYPEARAAKWPVLDLAFLGGLVLEVAGVPIDAYFAANAALRDRCAGRYSQCPDKALVDAYHHHVFGELGILGAD